MLRNRSGALHQGFFFLWETSGLSLRVTRPGRGGSLRTRRVERGKEGAGPLGCGPGRGQRDPGRGRREPQAGGRGAVWAVGPPGRGSRKPQAGGRVCAPVPPMPRGSGGGVPVGTWLLQRRSGRTQAGAGGAGRAHGGSGPSSPSCREREEAGAGRDRWVRGRPRVGSLCRRSGGGRGAVLRSRPRAPAQPGSERKEAAEILRDTPPPPTRISLEVGDSKQLDCWALLWELLQLSGWAGGHGGPNGGKRGFGLPRPGGVASAYRAPSPAKSTVSQSNAGGAGTSARAPRGLPWGCNL